jgi:hypothetical protein
MLRGIKNYDVMSENGPVYNPGNKNYTFGIRKKSITS